ncbi:MAG: cytochrome c oxidase subunit II [Bacteroidota bacterium]
MEREGTFWLPPQSSTTAHEVDALFYFILVMSVIIQVGVTYYLVKFAWKYRRRSHADRPVDVHPSKWLEISWVVVPTLLVFVVFFWGFKAFVSAGIAPDNAYQIHVVGKKWLWEFEYPDGTTSVGDLYVPVGEPIELIMTSTDVLHSFYVPEFRVKHDAIPNRYTTIWFEVKEEGEYQVLCTEYCGTAHSEMYAKVHAVDRGTFNDWLRTGGGNDNLPLNQLGELLYTKQACNNCHSVDGSSGIGPSWQGLWQAARPGSDEGVADANYIRTSIVNPNAYIVEGYQGAMPAYPNLTDRELNGLVAYIRDINGAWTAADSAAANDSTVVPADTLDVPTPDGDAELAPAD